MTARPVGRVADVDRNKLCGLRLSVRYTGQ
jgi:hypothetical protein